MNELKKIHIRNAPGVGIVAMDYPSADQIWKLIRFNPGIWHSGNQGKIKTETTYRQKGIYKIISKEILLIISCVKFPTNIALRS